MTVRRDLESGDPTPAPARVLVVHLRDGVVEVPLTGDPHADAILRRWAARGGPVIEQAA